MASVTYIYPERHYVHPEHHVVVPVEVPINTFYPLPPVHHDRFYVASKQNKHRGPSPPMIELFGWASFVFTAVGVFSAGAWSKIKDPTQIDAWYNCAAASSMVRFLPSTFPTADECSELSFGPWASVLKVGTVDDHETELKIDVLDDIVGIVDGDCRKWLLASRWTALPGIILLLCGQFTKYLFDFWRTMQAFNISRLNEAKDSARAAWGPATGLTPVAMVFAKVAAACFGFTDFPDEFEKSDAMHKKGNLPPGYNETVTELHEQQTLTQFLVAGFFLATGLSCMAASLIFWWQVAEKEFCGVCSNVKLDSYGWAFWLSLVGVVFGIPAFVYSCIVARITYLNNKRKKAAALTQETDAAQNRGEPTYQYQGESLPYSYHISPPPSPGFPQLQPYVPVERYLPAESYLQMEPVEPQADPSSQMQL